MYYVLSWISESRYHILLHYAVTQKPYISCRSSFIDKKILSNFQRVTYSLILLGYICILDKRINSFLELNCSHSDYRIYQLYHIHSVLELSPHHHPTLHL